MMVSRTYRFLASPRLALTLLIIILLCCVTGVTAFRGAEAGEKIFATLWFNGLLVLLVTNVACCFFPRIWGRKLTIVSFGMILFHLCFVVMLLGIVYNSLFHFHGIIRLAEGEVLHQGDPASWDAIAQGRFFDLSQLKGEIALKKMQKGYEIDGQNKMVAYEVAVRQEGSVKEGLIYITHRFAHNGFSYFREKEGYSILIVLYDRKGTDLFGAYVPLQSYRQEANDFLYSTGSKDRPESFPFPQGAMDPKFLLQAIFYPAPGKERDGEVRFAVWPLPGKEEKGTAPDPGQVSMSTAEKNDSNPHEGVPLPGETLHGAKTAAQLEDNPLFEGKVPLGKKFSAGDYSLVMEEVRYWAAMTVRYDPGKYIVLTALWIGLGGMIITFFGRIIRGRKKRP